MFRSALIGSIGEPRGLLRRAALVGGCGAVAFVVGALIARGAWDLALIITIAIPVAAVVAVRPFAGVLLWILVLPFFIKAEEANAEIWVLHRVAIPGLLALVAAYHFLGIRRSSFRVTSYDVGLVLFLVVGAVNVAWFASQPTRTMVSFYDHLAVPITLFWLVRAIGPTRQDLGWLIAVGVWTIAVQGTIGTLSWIAPNLLPDVWLGRAGERTVGTFGGPSYYTITLMLFALLATYSAMTSSLQTRRFALMAVVALAFLGVFLSLSRGSWLGAAVAVVGLLVLYPRALRFALGGAVLMALLAFGPFASQVSLAQERLGIEETVEARIITNDAAFRMIADRPLIGFGFGNFELFDESYKQRVGDTPLILGGSAHNTYLNFVAEFGIPASVFYFAPAAWLLVATVRRRHLLRQQGDRWKLLMILWLALLDQLVVSNFLEIIHPLFWATALWWLTLGLIASILRRADLDIAPVRPGFNAT
jgi:O-antigen ligase